MVEIFGEKLLEFQANLLAYRELVEKNLNYTKALQFEREKLEKVRADISAADGVAWELAYTVFIILICLFVRRVNRVDSKMMRHRSPTPSRSVRENSSEFSMEDGYDPDAVTNFEAIARSLSRQRLTYGLAWLATMLLLLIRICYVLYVKIGSANPFMLTLIFIILIFADIAFEKSMLAVENPDPAVWTHIKAARAGRWRARKPVKISVFLFSYCYGLFFIPIIWSAVNIFNIYSRGLYD